MTHAVPEKLRKREAFNMAAAVDAALRKGVETRFARVERFPGRETDRHAAVHLALSIATLGFYELIHGDVRAMKRDPAPEFEAMVKKLHAATASLPAGDDKNTLEAFSRDAQFGWHMERAAVSARSTISFARGFAHLAMAEKFSDAATYAPLKSAYIAGDFPAPGSFMRAIAKPQQP